MKWGGGGDHLNDINLSLKIPILSNNKANFNNVSNILP